MHSTGGEEFEAASISLICPRCGGEGCAVWEREKWGRSLASLSGNFYERLAKLAPYKIEVVCHGCGVAAAVRPTDPSPRLI